MTLELRKYRLIKLITSLNNELVIQKLESLLEQLGEDDKLLLSLTRPMRESIDIEELMKEQNYKHPSKETLEEIMKEANIEESIEDLLRMI